MALFSVLYFGTGFLFTGLSALLIRKNIARPISHLPRFEKQLFFEIKHGIFSILIFALYGTLIVFLIRQNILAFNQTNGIMILVDLLILAIWNEIHFYLVHRMMHLKVFLPFHHVHHKSVVVTPFSAYSFHPLESLLNGSVMIIPMFVYDFEILALILLPAYSIVLNMAGHSNVQLIFISRLKSALKMSTRHNAHHTRFNTNFGFATPLMDFLFSQKKASDQIKKTESQQHLPNTEL